MHFLCLQFLSKKAKHVHAGIPVLSWDDQPPEHLYWARYGCHAHFSSDRSPLFLSDSQHLNLVSACHTQAYWIISLFLLILVYVTEIIITVIVFCAINYRSCGLFIYLFLDSGVNW